MTLDMGFLTTVDKIASVFKEASVFSVLRTIPQKLQPFLKRNICLTPGMEQIKSKKQWSRTPLITGWYRQKRQRNKNEQVYQLGSSTLFGNDFCEYQGQEDDLHAFWVEKGLKVSLNP